MTVLAFDSSTLACSACVMKDGKILASRYLNTGLTHSQTLLPLIESVLQEAAISIDEIDRIGVAIGPGSFTGIKIAVATAKGLAHKNKSPCAGISSLEALACNIPFEGTVCAAEDARRSMIYNANFKNNNRMCEDRQISIENLLKEAQEPLFLCGDGAHLVEEQAKRQGIRVQCAPPDRMFIRAENVAYLTEKLSQEELCSPEELQPKYLRLPQAERERNEQESKKGNNTL